MPRFSALHVAHVIASTPQETCPSAANPATAAKAALAVPDEVARSVKDFSTDSDVIYRWRDGIADLIEAER